MYEDKKDVIEGGYVPMPRKYVSDYRDGLLSKPELSLLIWVRCIADMTGVCHCSMKSLADEAFNSPVSVSYVNKLLRSLKSKRYLWYRDRNGRRGSFEVHVKDWLLKNGKLKDITKNFENESVIANSVTEHVGVSEVSRISEVESQRIEERKRSIKSMLSRLPSTDQSEVAIQKQTQI